MDTVLQRRTEGRANDLSFTATCGRERLREAESDYMREMTSWGEVSTKGVNNYSCSELQEDWPDFIPPL